MADDVMAYVTSVIDICPFCRLPYSSTKNCQCVNSGTPIVSWDQLSDEALHKFEYGLQQGWQCPSCKVIYAPHVDSCECEKQEI